MTQIMASFLSNHSWGGRMKYLYILCMFLILACIVAAYIDCSYRCKELQAELQIERAVREKQDEDLSKDVRVLKTDVHILQYGYEENYDR